MSVRKHEKVSHGVPIVEWITSIKDENGERKRYYFSEHRLGKYAKLLAEEMDITKIRSEVYVECLKDYAIMHIYSKTFGYFDVLISLEDVDRVKKYTWHPKKRRTGKGFYINNNQVGKLHQFIMNVDKKSGNIIDHINRDTLDNRRENLRFATASDNMKNINIQSNNKSGITGVRTDGKYWWAQISIDGKQTIKSFSIQLYGEDIAKEMAIKWRKEKENEQGYLGE